MEEKTINYKILFESLGAGGETLMQGDIVTGAAVAGNPQGIQYLLDIGAIEETDEEPRRIRSAADLNVEIETAIANATDELQTKVTELESKVEELEKQLTEDGTQNLIDENDKLTKELADLKTAINDGSVTRQKLQELIAEG